MSGGKKNETFFSAILKFSGLSAIAGVLAMVVLAPIILVGGFAASAGISIFENLPDYIKPVNASQASTIYGIKNGEPVEVAKFYNENRISIDYNDMSPNIRNAVVATEDPRFFEHGGVDIISLIRATLTNAAMGGGGPGGSTITMQYVKNSLVEAANLSGDLDAIADATRATVDRKLREIRLAIALEGVATKQRDSGRLPEPGLLWQPDQRCRIGIGVLLRCEGKRFEHSSGCAFGGDAQVSE